MFDYTHPIAKLSREDGRYAVEAYVFVFDALRFAQEKLGMGVEVPSDSEVGDAEVGEAEQEIELHRGGREREARTAPRHLTGQELCEAIRRYALEQYGLMAKCVLNQWGVRNTGDFGEIVFNLIRIGEMRKTPDDRREDFDDVFDFEDGLVKRFRIQKPE